MVNYTSSSNLKTVAHGSFIAFFGRAAGVCLQYGHSILIARLLGAKLMGAFFLGITVLNILSAFARFGLDQGLLKFVSISLAEVNYVKAKRFIIFSIKIVIITSGILAVFLYLSKGILSIHIFHDKVLKTVFSFIALILPFFSLYTLLTETLKAFKRIAVVVFSQNFIFPIISILAFLILYFLGLHLKAALTAYFIASLFTFLIVCFFYKMLLVNTPKAQININKKELFSVSIPMYWSSIMALFMSWTDIVMLGVFQTTREVGIYTAAAKTAAFVAFFLVAVNHILPPIAAQLYNKGDIKELESIARHTARWNLIFSLLVTSVFFLFGKEMLSLYGKEFVIAYIPLLLLSFGQIINAGVGSVGYILAMTGFQNKLAYITTTAAILNVALNAVLIPLFSIKGAALATGISLSIWNLIIAYFVYKDVKIKAFSDSLFKIISGVGILILVSFITKTFAGVCVGMIVFLTLSLIMMYKIFLDDGDILLITIMSKKLGLKWLPIASKAKHG